MDVRGKSGAIASSFAPAGEWGRADTDRRHQFNFLGTVSAHPASVLTEPPFNVTTGADDNNDGMAVDRPSGATRNTGLGSNTLDLDVVVPRAPV